MLLTKTLWNKFYRALYVVWTAILFFGHVRDEEGDKQGNKWQKGKLVSLEWERSQSYVFSQCMHITKKTKTHSHTDFCAKVVLDKGRGTPVSLPVPRGPLKSCSSFTAVIEKENDKSRRDSIWCCSAADWHFSLLQSGSAVGDRLLYCEYSKQKDQTDRWASILTECALLGLKGRTHRHTISTMKKITCVDKQIKAVQWELLKKKKRKQISRQNQEKWQKTRAAVENPVIFSKVKSCSCHSRGWFSTPTSKAKIITEWPSN